MWYDLLLFYRSNPGKVTYNERISQYGQNYSRHRISPNLQGKGTLSIAAKEKDPAQLPKTKTENFYGNSSGSQHIFPRSPRSQVCSPYFPKYGRDPFGLKKNVLTPKRTNPEVSPGRRIFTSVHNNFKFNDNAEKSKYNPLEFETQSQSNFESPKKEIDKDDDKDTEGESNTTVPSYQVGYVLLFFLYIMYIC